MLKKKRFMRRGEREMSRGRGGEQIDFNFEPVPLQALFQERSNHLL
jgi:hypothetical protein